MNHRSRSNVLLSTVYTCPCVAFSKPIFRNSHFFPVVYGQLYGLEWKKVWKDDPAQAFPTKIIWDHYNLVVWSVSPQSITAAVELVASSIVVKKFNISMKHTLLFNLHIFPPVPMPPPTPPPASSSLLPKYVSLQGLLYIRNWTS